MSTPLWILAGLAIWVLVSWNIGAALVLARTRARARGGAVRRAAVWARLFPRQEVMVEPPSRLVGGHPPTHKSVYRKAITAGYPPTRAHVNRRAA